MLKPPITTKARTPRRARESYLTPFTDADFRDKFQGLEPAQWVDVQALRGDASDNIPG